MFMPFIKDWEETRAGKESAAPMTNADHIRAMSDEELAAFLDGVQEEECKAIHEVREDGTFKFESLREGWLAWLQEAAEPLKDMQYIERGALCQALDGIIKDYIAEKTFQGNFAAGVLCDFRDTVLTKIPDADVAEVVHADWGAIRKGFYECSRCGRKEPSPWGGVKKIYPYCHCGARMDGE